VYEKATEKPGVLEIEEEEEEEEEKQAADCNTRRKLAAEVLIDREASSIISSRFVRKKCTGTVLEIIRETFLLSKECHR
jgi:hypothetical protein